MAVVARHHAQLFEQRELVPVLAECTDLFTAELGDGDTSQRDSNARRLEVLVGRDAEVAGVRHRDGPLDARVVAPDVERRDLQLEIGEGIITAIEFLDQLGP